MAQYDLTPQLAKFMDRHMVVPLLDHVAQQKLYSEEEIHRAKFELLSKTKMIDFTNSIYQKLHGTDANMDAYEDQRVSVLQQLHNLSEDSHEAQAIIEEAVAEGVLKNDRLANHEYLMQETALTSDMTHKLYEYALILFQVGLYEDCSKALNAYRLVVADKDRYLSVLWGLFACEILMSDWEKAWELLRFLQDVIENTRFNDAAKQLLNRVFLIHWSLFPFFNHPKGRDGIVDLFFQRDYINSISKECPWILRYLTTAVVINQRKRSMLPDLVKVVPREAYQYRDPVTDFIESLYVKTDFEEAQRNLAQVHEVLSNDLFLHHLGGEFVENARLLMFESYVRIHQRIDITSLPKRLNMSNEEGERWIVNLIRNARLDAKIDTSTNTVIMGYNVFPGFGTGRGGHLTQQQQLERSMRDGGMYQVIIDKTKGLNLRSQVLINHLEKREKDGDGGRHRRSDNDRLGLGPGDRRRHHGKHDHRDRDGDHKFKKPPRSGLGVF